jgi:hypothetical protein
MRLSLTVSKPNCSGHRREHFASPAGNPREEIYLSRKMNKVLAATLAIASLFTIAPAARAQYRVQPQSMFAPTVTFQDGNTAWSIENSTFFSPEVSLRSRVSFANSAPNVGTQYSTSLNYSFSMDDEAKTFSPYLGVGVAYASGTNSRTTGFAQAGIDLDFESMVVTANVALPFDGSKLATSVGLGFRF